MSDTASLRFSCESCAKSYAYKPELANRKVKCKCGAVMVVPDLSAPSVEEDTYDIADDPKPAAVAVPKPVPRAASQQVTQPTGRAVAQPVPKPSLAYARGPNKRERDAARTSIVHDMTRDVYVPTALIVVSFVAYTIFTMFFENSRPSEAAIFTLIMGVVFFFKTLLMIGAAFILAPILGVSFGPLWTAILKLAAVAMAPDVLATIIEDSIGVTGAGLLANSIALAVYWFLISYLFQLDASEAWWVVIGFAILRWILSFVIALIVVGFMMSGAASSVTSAAGNAMAANANPVATFDADIERLRADNQLEEAKQYIAGGRQSFVGPFVTKWYASGAKNVWFLVERDINGKTDPYSLVVEWPDDKTKRAAVLADLKAYYGQLGEGYSAADMTDEGGKYVEVDLK